MNCDKFREMLAKECIDALDLENKKLLEMHLAKCRFCREEREIWRHLWANLEEIPLLEPGPQVRERFYTMLGGYLDGMDPFHGKSPKGFQFFEMFKPWFRPVFQFGIGAFLILLGGIVGYWIRSDHGGHADIAGLREEISETRQMLAVSLLNQSSASERLKGVSWSVQVKKPDPQFLETLVRTLNDDPNINVRLAAMDALAHFADVPDVRKKLVDSLSEQDFPLVQIMLIRVLVQLQEHQSIEVMKNLSSNTKQNPQVREQAQWGLQQLL
jgi:hypothetical protein